MNETIELVPVSFEKVLQSSLYTCFVLQGEEKSFGIYTDLSSGETLRLYLSDIKKSRPHTHDLLNQIFRGLDIKVKQVVITDIQDTIFFARLFLEMPMGEMTHIVEIDARPSDCITLALQHKAPVYCDRAVLEKTTPFIE